MCQLCQAPLHRAVFVGLSLALLASCASPSESGSTVETTEPPSSAADASAPEVPVELHCLEVVTLAGEEQPQYRRLTWYADRRALKVEFSSDPEFQSGNGAKVTAFASDGRLIRTIHLGGPDPQEDYFYDAGNNRIDYRYSYPTSPSLDVASNEEPRLAILNKNEYDAQGRLAATIMAEYGLDSEGFAAISQSVH